MSEQQSVEEIDLGYLVNKFKQGSKGIVRSLFSIFAFYLKFWIVILALILVGVGIGYYLDSNSKTEYENQGIVIPNFESVDFLYTNVKYLNEKIRNRDSTFLKTILSDDYKALKKIEIEPISDMYNMMTKSREQIDVFRILFQNQELDKFFEDISTSKYFKYHKINVVTRGEKNSREVIAKLFDYWNANELYSEYRSVYQENADFQKLEYEKMITQVDSILASVVRSNEMAASSGVRINENSNLFALFERKFEMLDELLEIQKRQINYSETVRLVNIDYNKEVHRLSNKIKFPIYLILLFSLAGLVIYTIKSLKRYADNG